MLESLFSHARNVGQLFPTGERPVLITIFDNRLSQPLRDPGDVLEQIDRRRIQIDADSVDARLHAGTQADFEFLLVDIMLVLTDPDGLRIDLDQLRQGIL